MVIIIVIWGKLLKTENIIVSERNAFRWKHHLITLVCDEVFICLW